MENSKIINIKGKRFSRLLVLEFSHVDKTGTAHWRCICDCGKAVVTSGSRLRHNRTRSCGCGISVGVRTKQTKPAGYSGLSILLNRYRNNAKANKHSFELTREEFKGLVEQNCHYCGATPSQVAEHSSLTAADRANSKFTYNGIDRVDSSLGYTVNNCVPCCFLCNWAKLDNSAEYFLTWVRRLVSFQRAQQNQFNKA